MVNDKTTEVGKPLSFFKLPSIFYMIEYPIKETNAM